VAAISIAVAVLFPSNLANAQISIDFNNGTPFTVVGSFYAALGITFSNGMFYPPIPQQQFMTPSSGVFLTDVGDNGFSPPFSPTVNTPIVGIFSSPVSFVALLAFDVGV